ncbi:universal stress protein [Halovivax cerinus]|uniref:Universal stress protein n=1 Tax=Halovivax cerinus TaxID=1487865 RepID=A0ABD5NT02_9EURY|nr:universal stress protein [Halovivax cerinus]
MVDSAALSVETILAPVDGSDASTNAVEHAVELADRYDATVHVLFVLGREVVLGMDADAVAEDDVAQNVQTYLADVRSYADERAISITTSTVHGFSRERKTTHPGSVVLDTADDIDADLVVVPRPSTDGPATVLETVAEYVLGYASQPVLSV